MCVSWFLRSCVCVLAPGWVYVRVFWRVPFEVGLVKGKPTGPPRPFSGSFGHDSWCPAPESRPRPAKLLEAVQAAARRKGAQEVRSVPGCFFWFLFFFLKLASSKLVDQQSLFFLFNLNVEFEHPTLQGKNVGSPRHTLKETRWLARLAPQKQPCWPVEPLRPLVGSGRA